MSVALVMIATAAFSNDCGLLTWRTAAQTGNVLREVVIEATVTTTLPVASAERYDATTTCKNVSVFSLKRLSGLRAPT